MFFSYPTAPHLAAFILRFESVRGPHRTHRPLSVSDRLRLSDLARHSSIASEAHDSRLRSVVRLGTGCTRLAVILPSACARAAIKMQDGRRRSALSAETDAARRSDRAAISAP
jgi:hypothetical protein